MGTEYTRAHAADLAANLPADSCCGVAEDPDNIWTLEAVLLALIEFHLRNWNWAHTEDAKHKRNVPRPLAPLGAAKAQKAGAAAAMTVDEMMEFVGGLVGKKEDGDG